MTKGMTNELVTIIVAALPISELRGAIPLALLTFKIPLLKAVLLSVLGNLLPVIPLLLYLKPVGEKLRRFRLWHNFFNRFLERTKKKAALVEKYEALGLLLFVAVPLPATGAWTGCFAASLFKIRFRYALIAITLGVCLAAIIVTSVVLMGKGILFYLYFRG